MAGYNNYTPMYQPYYYANTPYQVQYQDPAMPQPQQQAMQNVQPTQQTQNPSSILWVRNNQEAAMYPVAPNNAVALWDSGAPVIYLKQADAAGKPSMKTYDLVERVEKPTEAPQAQEGNNTTYALKSDLAALAGVVKDVDGVVASLREEIDTLKSKAPAKRGAKKEDEADG